MVINTGFDHFVNVIDVLPICDLHHLPLRREEGMMGIIFITIEYFWRESNFCSAIPVSHHPAGFLHPGNPFLSSLCCYIPLIMRQARLVAAKTTGEDVQTDFTANTAGGGTAIGSGVSSTSAASTAIVNSLRLKKTQIWARLTGFPHWPGTQTYSSIMFTSL